MTYARRQRRPITLAALLWTFGTAAIPAAAQVRSQTGPVTAGAYVGADVALRHYDNACLVNALSCDDTGPAAGVFGGYRFGSRWSLELGYYDLGEADAVYPRLTTTLDVTGTIDGYALTALAAFPLTDTWEVFVRGGAFRWDAATASREFAASASDWSPAAGVGIGWHFRPAWQARLHYLMIADAGDATTGETHGQLLAAGVSYRFGRAAAAAPVASSITAPPPAPAPIAAAPVAAAAALPPCPAPEPLLDTEVYFGFDSARPSDTAALEPLLERLRRSPRSVVRVTGYTDSSGAGAYNLALSRRRAEAVADYFRNRGIDESRMTVDGAGESELITGEGRARDDAVSRRVRVVVPAVDASTNLDCKPANP